MRNFVNIPYVIEQTGRGEKGYDLYSRLLVDRIISWEHRSMTWSPMSSWLNSFSCR